MGDSTLRQAVPLLAQGAAMNPLGYLREAKRDLTPEQQRTCDDLVLGVLSLHVSDQVWRDAVDMAVRLAGRKTIGQNNEACKWAGRGDCRGVPARTPPVWLGQGDNRVRPDAKTPTR